MSLSSSPWGDVKVMGLVTKVVHVMVNALQLGMREIKWLWEDSELIECVSTTHAGHMFCDGIKCFSSYGCHTHRLAWACSCVCRMIWTPPPETVKIPLQYVGGGNAVSHCATWNTENKWMIINQCKCQYIPFTIKSFQHGLTLQSESLIF